MKLVPLSDRVVLKQLKAEEKTKSGIILASAAQEKPQEAEVIAVGPGGNKMSDIAAKLNITVGSLTTSMNSLVKKGYATRERSEQDRRVVFIHLTLKGRKAYHHHAEFHRKMTDAVLDVLDENEALVLAKALDRLTLFFRQYKS